MSDPAPHAPRPWRTSRLVRFSHCDPAGIVYFARWFDLMNGVVEDWFGQALGLDYHGFISARIGLGYAHAEADFSAPGLMGDQVEFGVEVERVGGASLALKLPATRAGAPLLRGRLVMVTTSLDENRAIPLPDALRAAAGRYQESCR